MFIRKKNIRLNNRNLFYNYKKRNRKKYIVSDNSETLSSLDELINVIKHLRNPHHGCEWDLKQSIYTLKEELLEETYELIESIERNNKKDIEEELGDLLFIALILIYMAEQTGITTFDKSIRGIVDKLISRHPHVFNELKVKNTAEILSNWEKIKQSQKKNKSVDEVLNSIPRNLPGLQRLYRLTGKLVKLNKLSIDSKQIFKDFKKEIKTTTTINKKNLQDFIFILVKLAYIEKIKPEESIQELINEVIV